MNPHRTIVVDKPFLKTGCVLGEAPLYDEKTSTLHFVDIVKCQVLHLNLVTSELSVDQFDEPVSCIALRRNRRGLACAAARGFAVIDPDTRKLNYLSTPLNHHYLNAGVRFNDGACDSQGRFFAGTIFSKEHNIPGQLFRYDPFDDTTVVVDEGPFTDSNGLGWGKDEKTFYFTDSLVNIIYAYDYNNGSLSNRRVFADGISAGLPSGTFADGLCVDSEGGVWSARWGGSSIVRFGADGRVDLQVHFPFALNITACCFGGPEEDQLFVTTAHCSAIGGDPSRQAIYPDSGHLFRVDLSSKFKGGKWRFEFGG
ncbi:regucalcin [Rickenella mellea]|uniref:Regucalcin n=1 Tax=Rickenella mellea TaxID=50990 RepID=A0A4Y7QN66_9AGAM|nr:regucalcin [Rickenella mellea]